MKDWEALRLDRRRLVEEVMRILSPHMDFADVDNRTDVEAAVCLLLEQRDLVRRDVGSDRLVPPPSDAPVIARRAFHMGRVLATLSLVIPDEIKRCQIEQGGYPAAGPAPTDLPPSDGAGAN